MKPKYTLNLETLNYEPYELTLKQKLIRFGIYSVITVALSGAIYLGFSQVYDSPKEFLIKRENEFLKTQYALLNKKVSHISNVLSELEYKDNNIYRTIFEAEPIPKSLKESGIGGVNRYSAIEGYNNSNLIIKTKKKIDLLSKQLYFQSKSLDQVNEIVINKELMLSSIPAIRPVNGKDLKRMASGFGMRIDPHYKVRKMHEGMDFSAPTGTPIYSTGDGIVMRADRHSSGFGNHVRVDHGFGYVTLYAHMSKIKVTVGQKVSRGDILGLVGNTGKSKGPHCHYEVRKNGIPINPINFYFNDLSPEEYNQILELAENSQQSLD